MHKISFIIAGVCSLVSLTASAQEIRPRTAGEDKFWKRADHIVRAALPHAPGNGWELASETPDDSGFQPDVTWAKDKGPYSYVYEISYVRNPETVQQQLDSVAKLVAGAPGRAEELVKTMERISASAQCRIVVTVNSSYSVANLCAGKPSFPTYPSATAAVRVPAGPDCGAGTLLLVGKFSKLRTDMLNERSATISANGMLTGGGPFSLHNIGISITAEPEVADFFIRKTDIAGLAALIGSSLQ